MLRRLPHTLPHKFRVMLFRDEATREKKQLATAAPKPHFTIRRGHVLTDGAYAGRAARVVLTVRGRRFP